MFQMHARIFVGFTQWKLTQKIINLFFLSTNWTSKLLGFICQNYNISMHFLKDLSVCKTD